MFEDFLLAQPRFQLHGDHKLGELALVASLWSQEKPARKLLRQRRGPANLLAANDPVIGGLDSPYGIEADMIEKAVVLDRQNRVDQYVGNAFVGQNSPLRPFLVE